VFRTINKVCSYCCRFVDTAAVIKKDGHIPYDELNDVASKRHTRINSMIAGNNANADKTTVAVQAMKEKMDAESSKLQYLTVKIETENALRRSMAGVSEEESETVFAKSPRLSPRAAAAAPPPSSLLEDDSAAGNGVNMGVEVVSVTDTTL
jgi:hypothetical protein